MIRPILHIGFPKTATTWFQEVFYPNVQNINYFKREVVQKLFLIPGAFDWNKDKCNERIESLIDTNANKNTRVICEELLLGRLRAGGVKHFVTKEVAKRLKDIFPEASIVIFIRNQIDVLVSSYFQYIQSGGNYSIDKFLYPKKISGGDYNNMVLLGIEYFEYHKVIEYYIELFGKDNVHIFLYEEFNNSPQEFIKKYNDKFGFVVNERDLAYQKVNRGYRVLLIPLRKLCNSLTRNGPLNKYYLIHIPKIDWLIRAGFQRANRYKIFGRKKSAKYILGKKNLDYLRCYYRNSNRLLLEKYRINEIIHYQYPI